MLFLACLLYVSYFEGEYHQTQQIKFQTGFYSNLLGFR